MKGLLTIFAIIFMVPAVSFAKGINGTWLLPPKANQNVEISITSNGKDVIAIVSVNTNCNKPVHAALSGTVKKNKGKYKLALVSPKIRMPKNCSLTLFIEGNIKVAKHIKMLNVINGKAASVIKCPNKLPIVGVDNISGKWYMKAKKRRKPASKFIEI